VTLENLKQALYLNNEVLLQKLNNVAGNETQLELLRQQNALLTEEINQLSEALDSINRTVIS
jgi:hypothetical protein